MERKKLKHLEIGSTLLLVFAVVTVVGVMLQVTSKGYVTIGGYSMFRVATGSMEPTIETGALLICDQTPIEDIQVDDIICFESTSQMMLGQVITHRVVDIQLVDGILRLTTRGDANVVEDALYVTEKNLIGKVTWYSQDKDIMASVISFMSGKIGFLSLIVIPVLLISSIALKESMKSIKHDMYELRRLEIEAARRKQEEQQKQMLLEADEELIARLRAEIRKELGLDDGEQQKQSDD